MKNSFGLLAALVVGATLASPVAARADYLYSVFRDSCTPDTVTRYSGADPIIASVHMRKSEFDRVASNYMTWGGFQLFSDSFVTTSLPNSSGTVKELVKTKGRLYAMRLFQEQTENSNQWDFNDFDSDTVLDACDMDDGTFDGNKTCVFEAGSLLNTRDKRTRYIYSGRVGTPLTPTSGNEGALTIPIASTEQLSLTDLPTTEPSAWLASSFGQLYNGTVLEAAVGEAAAVKKIKNDVWAPYAALSAIQTGMQDLPTNLPAALDTYDELKLPKNLQFAKMLKWLFAEGAARAWPLGDIYHSSTAVVEAPERHYRDRAYPYFKSMFRKRPEMIYVGANDGMIHGFYAAPDIFAPDDQCGTSRRWKPGEEAWAYLPATMLAKTAVAVERGRQRFFSQDLSCRFTDVQIDTSFTTCDETTWKWPWQVTDPKRAYCGWRTLLVCGQGWGGSWYTTLDVTDPLGPFRKDDGSLDCTRTNRARPLTAMWEATYLPANGSTVAMGKSWSLPFIGLVNFDGTPKWLSMMGSGYNTDMQNCPKYSGGSCSAITGTPGVAYQSRSAYRRLNLDYSGKYPQHGDGVGAGPEGAYAFLLDLATGEFLKNFTFTGQQAVVADIPAVDSDQNGLIDAAYVAGWNGKIGRVYFSSAAGSTPQSGTTGGGAAAAAVEETTLSSIGYKNGGSECWVSTSAGQRVLATHPTAFGVPPRSTDTFRDKVMIVQGTGVNTGDDPDQQRNNGNFWDIEARTFTDNGTSSCPGSTQVLCGANSWWTVNDNDGAQKPRLLGAPIFSRQSNGDDWLVYTTWSPPPANDSNQCRREGIAKLWCLDVTDSSACKECNGFAGQGKSYNITLYSGEQPPSAPVSADGNIYVTGEDGPIVQGIVDSGGQAPNANSYAPTTGVTARVVSWREVF